MKFELKSTGFITEFLTIEVVPSKNNPATVDVKITSSLGLLNDMWEDTYVKPKTNSFIGVIVKDKYHEGNHFFQEGNLPIDEQDADYYDAEYSTWVNVASIEIEIYLKNLTTDFFSHHKALNERANLTIEKIRSLKIEDIVGEQAWEVVKTTSRRGVKRG